MSRDSWVRVPEAGDEDDEEEQGQGQGPGQEPGPDQDQEQDPEPTPTPTPTPAPRPGVEQSTPCWNCGAPVTPRDPHCTSCDRTRTHALLVCTDPCLELRHGPGPPLTLGRHPDWAPDTAALFADRPKVSRRHVSITVAPDGSAWAEEPPEGSHNGTFINGAKLMPGVRTPLRDNDQLRLGLRISITVRLYGPDPRDGTG
ncbi:MULTISPECIES: FHA domain-containing protein [unclassified Streptomyces]|uniref:FHA domain-containing protein n=1 Tax=unclassified Streptomyces TaxID=2593676 RepID=UPI00336A28E6